ncbi:MJ1255/VC2487 family glycosyltransferase [Halioxenophilus aromaticivorans]|uniref:Glycosyltransferase family protein n=1 Tax=Halioxenophilus aromaticivorans TaxID=1306992 RepID=A0AAV3UA85_9ALTE
MKILYGVQGTGNGHITRARAMAKAFAARPDAEVDYVFSGRDKHKYFDMDPFGDYASFRGLTFRHKAGKISPTATIKSNKLLRLLQDVKNLSVADYDLVVTDFEPITAWAGKLARKPVIGVGHQYAFRHKIPKKGDSWAANTVMNMFAPVSLGLGLHWHHFGAPILPPIADTNDADQEIEPDKILVYLGFEAPDKVIDMLSQISGYRFFYYGEFEKAHTQGSIHFRPLSRDGFQRDLATASGVICNAGFELASEALELGKKLLVKPLFGQMEQLSNAQALKELQLGSVMQKLDASVVEDWLANQPNVKIHYPNVAGAIVNWLLNGEWTDATRLELCQMLWSGVHTADIDNYSKIEQLAVG